MEVACCFPWLHSLQWKLGREWLGHCTLPKCNVCLHQRGVFGSFWEALQEHCLDHWSLLVLSLQSHYARGSFQFLNGTNEHPDGLRDFPSKLAESFEYHSCIQFYKVCSFSQISRKIAPGGWLTAAFPGREETKSSWLSFLSMFGVAIGSMHLQHVVVVLLWITSSHSAVFPKPGSFLPCCPDLCGSSTWQLEAPRASCVINSFLIVPWSNLRNIVSEVRLRCSELFLTDYYFLKLKYRTCVGNS